MDFRRLLLELFDAALKAADGRHAVARQLEEFRAPAVSAFAIGKAASAMALGARDALGARLKDLFLVTKDGHVDPALRDSRSILLETAHPVPDERSLAAGAEFVGRLGALADDTLPLFLVSGGASSLIESLREGHTLADLRQLNQHGLAAGWDIGRLNAARAGLSVLKRGGVARLLAGRPALALFISDVPDDDPSVIGSGLLGEAQPSPGVSTPDRIERHVVAHIGGAVSAVVEAGHARGLELLPRVRFDGDAAAVAGEFVAALRDTSADGLVWGGESTVTLTGPHGRGGRNTHLALAAARLLRADEPLGILAAGTDGTDGPTQDAGAIIDGGTRGRAELGGCDVDRAFAQFDSGAALEAAADLLYTGPTGTNVGDVLIGLKTSARRPRVL